MSSLLVTGGQQKGRRSSLTGAEDWREYHKGVILSVDTTAGTCCKQLEYATPTTVSSRHESLFKTGTIDGNRLYICTQTEVLIYGLPDFGLISYISLPCFNDLHHVRLSPDGHLLLANTGLDMVLMMTPEGDVLKEWSVLGEEPWARFSKELDYRSIDTRPHRAHPNFVFTVGHDVWATRLQHKDAVCLTQPGKRIAIDVGLPHDGVVCEGRIYFSTVNGHVAIADATTLRVEEIIDLNAIHGPDVQLGWCRGLLMGDDGVWIGFSRLRSTRLRENVKWVIQGCRTVLPTRIARYDLTRQRCVAQIDLEDYGLNAVYGVFPAPDVMAHDVATTPDATTTLRQLDRMKPLPAGGQRAWT
jgi:hypothetical protein